VKKLMSEDSIDFAANLAEAFKAGGRARKRKSEAADALNRDATEGAGPGVWLRTPQGGAKKRARTAGAGKKEDTKRKKRRNRYTADTESDEEELDLGEEEESD